VIRESRESTSHQRNRSHLGLPGLACHVAARALCVHLRKVGYLLFAALIHLYRVLLTIASPRQAQETAHKRDSSRILNKPRTREIRVEYSRNRTQERFGSNARETANENEGDSSRILEQFMKAQSRIRTQHVQWSESSRVWRRVHAHLALSEVCFA
jgi:hypothetical protein